MSSKKITDADKLEIVDLYRQSGDTTASLASRYGVSNSTISRLLKTNIPEAEYEILIQQKRVSKSGGEEDSPTTTDEPSVVPSTEIAQGLEINYGTSQPSPLVDNLENVYPVASTLPIQDHHLLSSPLPASTTEDSSANNRRVRRRSSAPLTAGADLSVASIDVSGFNHPAECSIPEATLGIDNFDLSVTNLPTKTTTPIPISRTPVLREILADSEHRYFTPTVPSPLDQLSADELEEDSDPEDVTALAAMFGEEISDGEDDEEFAEEDWEEESTSADQQPDRHQFLTSDRLHVQVIPLSQAILPRTCYVVVDKFAELIVRPLKDFADLGQISGEEIQQRTLPVFDNHRVAKRFSNQRTQRVIKVPDSRVFYKTTQHLRSKGITRLLVDGNIYSLN